MNNLILSFELVPFSDFEKQAYGRKPAVGMVARIPDGHYFILETQEQCLDALDFGLEVYRPFLCTNEPVEVGDLALETLVNGSKTPIQIDGSNDIHQEQQQRVIATWKQAMSARALDRSELLYYLKIYNENNI